MEARMIGEGVLDSVGVDARSDVEGAGAQGLGDYRVGLEAAYQAVDQRERSDSAGDLDRVDVRVDPVCWFVGRGPGRRVGKGREDQISAEVRPAIHLERHQAIGTRLDCPEPLDHLVVSEESVEAIVHVVER
jgi:hypothetical protein